MAKRGNGEGTISRRPDGRWMARASVGHDKKTGKLQRVTFYGKTRAEAAAKLNEALAFTSRGRSAPATKLTLGEWLIRWHETYSKPKVRQSTWEMYESLIRIHLVPGLGKMKLRDLRPEHLQRFYNEKLASGNVRREGGLAPRTVHYMHAVLHSSLKQAVREGLVLRNVAEDVSPPRHERSEIKPPSSEETARLLEAAKGHRLYLLFLLAWATGARRGELLGLRWQDIDLERRTMAIARTLHRTRAQGLVFTEPKTALSRRSIPLPKIACRELRAHKARQSEERLLIGAAYEDQGLVFATPDGKPMDPDNAARTFDALLKKAGLPHYRFHDLRHAFATRLLELGEHPKGCRASSATARSRRRSTRTHSSRQA